MSLVFARPAQLATAGREFALATTQFSTHNDGWG